MTTADYLESLQQDLATINESLGLQEETNFTDIATMAENGDITTGGGSASGFTGHYDATGLAQIGWTADDIAYYQNNAVLWNSELDKDYKLTSSELAGTAGDYARFIPKNSLATTFQANYRVIAIPLLNISKTDWSSSFSYCRNLITIPLFDTSNATKFTNIFNNCDNLIKIPLLNTINVTTMQNAFKNCTSLRTIPQLDTRNVTSMRDMFNTCLSLTYIPILNVSKVTNFTTMFNLCYSLSDDALYNILEMCKNASSYTSTKTLAIMGIDATQYSTRIQGLSNYQSFLNAGWTIE